MARIVHTRRTVSDEDLADPDRDTRGARPVVPRRRWPGVLAAMLLGAALAAVLVSSFYDPRSAGQKIDAAGQAVQDTVERVRADAAGRGATVAARTATTIGDAGITAAVKTALAADPALSALKIKVETENGVVSLRGPAPDAKARERAEVLAAAPDGVQRVDNRLVVTQ